jgi:hypothetical protein
VRSVAQFWTDTPLNSATDVKNISALISPGKKMPVQNPIPIILVTIIAGLAWIICFFAGIAVGTEQKEAGFPSWIISVKNVRAMSDSSE